MGNLNIELGNVVEALLVDHGEGHLIITNILINMADRNTTGLGGIAEIPIVSGYGAATGL